MNKGKFRIASNLEVRIAAALDPRVVVDSVADLYKLETWPNDGEVAYIYNGLVVACTENGGSVYILLDESNFTEEESWKRIDIGAIDLSYLATKEELNSAVEELNEKIETNATKINAIESALGTGDGSEESVLDKIANAAKQIESVQDDIDNLKNVTGDIAQLKTDVEEIKTDYVSATELNKVITDAIADLNKKLPDDSSDEETNPREDGELEPAMLKSRAAKMSNDYYDTNSWW